MKFDVTGSIVLYKNDREIVGEAIDSFLKCTLNVRLYLIDNSPTQDLQDLSADPRVHYIFNNGNIGFGKAHNIALRKSVDESKYHLVLNPDVYFHEGILENIFSSLKVTLRLGS